MSLSLVFANTTAVLELLTLRCLSAAARSPTPNAQQTASVPMCPSPENAALVRSALVRLSRFVRVENRAAVDGEPPIAAVRLRSEARAIGVSRVELRLRAQRPLKLEKEVVCAREALTLTVADELPRNRQQESLTLLGAFRTITRFDP